MKSKLRNVCAVILRTLIGIPILAALLAVYYGVLALIGVIIAHPIAALTVFMVVLCLFVSYMIGNVSVKKWRKFKWIKKNVK